VQLVSTPEHSLHFSSHFTHLLGAVFFTSPGGQAAKQISPDKKKFAAHSEQVEDNLSLQIVQAAAQGEQVLSIKFL
jgi:hypothetical protein